MNKRYIPWIKYGGAVVVSLVIGGLYLYFNDIFSATGSDVFRLLGDAFFLPGYLMILAGAWIWVTNEGALNGVSYCLKAAFYALIPTKHGKLGTYGDYVDAKREKKRMGYSFLFFVGLGDLAVGIIFLVLFY